MVKEGNPLLNGKQGYQLGIYHKKTQQFIGRVESSLGGSQYVENNLEEEQGLEVLNFIIKDFADFEEALLAVTNWIEQNLLFVSLIVCHEKQGHANIYRKNGWEYFGSNSRSLLMLDGEYYEDDEDPEILCLEYDDVRRVETHESIYVKRLDPALKLSFKPLPPCEAENLVTSEVVYKQKNNRYVEEFPAFYHDFGMLYNEYISSLKEPPTSIAVYDEDGKLEAIYNDCATAARNIGGSASRIREACRQEKPYHRKRFVRYFKNEDPPLSLAPLLSQKRAKKEKTLLCFIDGIPMYTKKQIADYTKSCYRSVVKILEEKREEIKGKKIEYK